jgi:hypothetical protein
MDYKICSSSIAQRIKKALNEIISETQTESWRVDTLVSVYDLYVTSYPMFWKIYCGDKFWYYTLYELESLTPKFDLFWRDVIVNYAKIHEIPSTDKNKSKEKWQQKLGKTISQDDWRIVYSIYLTHYLIQYKIYLRFLYTCTNERLMKCKLSETEMCSFLFWNQWNYDIFFYYFKHVRLLWLV